MWLVGLVDPGAESRRCSRRSLIVSVGLLGVPGRSRWASTSSGPILERPAQGDDLGRRLGRFADRVDRPDHRCAFPAAIGVPVGRDHPPVDRPCDLIPDAGIDGEQRLEPVLPLVGEDTRAGAQGRPRAVERIVLAAPAPRDRPLDAAPAPIQAIASKANDVEGAHHRDRVREPSSGSGREAGQTHPSRPPPPGRATPGVVRPAGASDQHPLPLGQDRVIRRTPRDPEALGDTGHGQVLVHDASQRPPQPTSRQPDPRLGRTTSVLTPYAPTADSPATAQDHLQHGRPPPEPLAHRPSESHRHAARPHNRTGDTTDRNQRRTKPAPRSRVRAAAP